MKSNHCKTCGRFVGSRVCSNCDPNRKDAEVKAAVTKALYCRDAEDAVWYSRASKKLRRHIWLVAAMNTAFGVAAGYLLWGLK